MARNKRRRKTRASRSVSALATAALALPCHSAKAQTTPAEGTFQIKHYYYHDWQSRGEDRMSIQAPMAYVGVPLSDTLSIQASTVLDVMSGASPLYHDTLTGASGLGVEDQRWAGDVSITKAFEDFDFTLGGEISDEDDYTARGGFFQTNIWSPSKNSTVTFGLSYSSDSITSTNNPDLDEDRETVGGSIGFTQVLSKKSVARWNLSYRSGDGFHSDQYKLSDNRPRSRDQLIFMQRYNRYFESIDSALHLDYRYYRDTWELQSHMVEAALYKTLSETLTMRPLVRYYTQSAAQFYSPLFPPDTDGFYSADQRTGAWGSYSAGLKFIYSPLESLSLDFLYEFIQQDPSFRLGGKGSASIDKFYAHFWGLGVTAKW